MNVLTLRKILLLSSLQPTMCVLFMCILTNLISLFRRSLVITYIILFNTSCRGGNHCNCANFWKIVIIKESYGKWKFYLDLLIIQWWLLPRLCFHLLQHVGYHLNRIIVFHFFLFLLITARNNNNNTLPIILAFCWKSNPILRMLKNVENRKWQKIIEFYLTSLHRGMLRAPFVYYF